MSAEVNKIRNADFSAGKAGPRGWVWQTRGKKTHWYRNQADPPGPPITKRGQGGSVPLAERRCKDDPGTAGITIVSSEPEGSASWSQVAVCKPGEFYRISATVTCNCHSCGDDGGFVLGVQPLIDSQRTEPIRVTPGLHRASQPIDVRTYYQAPPKVRRLEVSVGLLGTRGSVHIHHVHCMHILEPDQKSHPLAIPPPATALKAPRAVSTLSVCSEQGEERPIVRILSACFGDRNVQAIKPGDLRESSLNAGGGRNTGGGRYTGGLLLPDSAPPASIRSLAALERLAADRPVIISLSAFARLSRGQLTVRTVEQEDDPIHATVTFASYATNGFALADTFPYAWTGRTIGSFVQNQFRRTPALKRFCDQHGFVTMLVSMCCHDATSERPVCLYKPTPRGGLFVLDIEPSEAANSTLGEPALAMHLLLSCLGHTQPGLGQYVVPACTEVEFRGLIQEMGQRFPHCVVHSEDVPIEQVREQLVTIGQDDHAYGLPLKSKPVILVRSGLTSGDMESVYGALLWFKQLIRMEPYACPYAQRLASQFRLAWLPSAAPWESSYGFRNDHQPPDDPAGPTLTMEGFLGGLEEEEGKPAVLIDIVSRPIQRVRLLVPTDQGDYRRYLDWLPTIAEVFPSGCCFAPLVAQGEGFADRDRFAWRHAYSGRHACSGRHTSGGPRPGSPDPKGGGCGKSFEVTVEPAAFEDDAYRSVIGSGGQVLRLEVPGYDADFSAYSIPRTDVAATLLEQVIGLQYGLIAVNRSHVPVQFDACPPTEPGEALILSRHDAIMQSVVPQAG